jgi:hypothetical protein
VYFVYDRRDAATIEPWADLLFTDFEIIQPVLEGNEHEIRTSHEENLRPCDAALIFYGAADEAWLRRQLRQPQTAVRQGRTKPSPLVGVCLIAPRSAQKERFRTHEAIIIPQWNGMSPDAFQPFVTGVKQRNQLPADRPVE